ncbi:terminase large subunit domain-containing protein [Planctomicrobium sp. SH668]|uniref:terminase large subunit domain-containing protein n=1 Tax=Planctomicrobium sp. SH668 TaxID=3448126 RepID=UPI003F5BA5E6
MSLNESELETFLLDLNNADAVESVVLQIQSWQTPQEIVEQAKISPSIYRRHVLIQAGPKVVIYDEALDPWQRADLEAMDGAWEYMARVTSVRPKERRAYLERGRGHSKTTDIAAGVVWAILSSKSLLWGYAAASSEKQAGLIMKAIQMICKLNPWINDRIFVYENHIKNPLTGSTCEVVAANPKTTFGETPNFIICDELTHWGSEEVWSTLYSGIVKVPDSLMIVISNAGYGKGRSWHWILREKLRVDPAWYFRSLDGIQASWLTKEDLEEQLRILGTLEYRRLFLNKWLTDSTDGIPYHQIEACTVLAGPASGREHGWDYVIAGLDIGITRDRASLVFLGVSLARYKIGLMGHFTFDPREYPNGEVAISDIENTFWREFNRFGGVDALYADSYQAISTMQRMTAEGVRCFAVQFSGKQAILMAKRFVDGFRLGIYELYYDEVLESDILEIEVGFKELTRTYSLSAERTERGHADSAIALGIGTMGAMDWLDELVSSNGPQAHGNEPAEQTVET